MFFKGNKVLTIILIILSLFLYKNFTCLVPINTNINKNNKHYTNNLYNSDDHIYNQLDKSTKKIYNLIFNNYKNYKLTSTEIDVKDYNCESGVDCSNKVHTALKAITLEHPEMLNVSGGSWTYTDDSLSLSLTFSGKGPLINKIAEERIKRILEEIKQKTKNMSDVEKVKYVYDWMGDNNKYDDLFTYTSKNQSIYNVFIKHNAVCAGFAKASQVIFQYIGIKSYCVSGNSTGPHMWNIVKINNKYYSYDSTVSTCRRKKKDKSHYEGLNQEYLSTYTINYEKWYPELSTDEIFE